MGEINSDMQGRKTKTLKLAIVCALIPFVLFVGSFCFIAVLRNEHTENLQPYFFLFSLLGAYFSPVNFMLGIYALIKIKKSKGLLKGYVLSTLGILMSVLTLNFAMSTINCIRPEGEIRHCRFEMIEIGKALHVYSIDYDNHYPSADKWCDLLVEHTDIEKTVLIQAEPEWRRNSFRYAINPNAKPNSPPDVVLLFEMKGGWNKFGGPELVTFEKHYRKGCNILFNDGHVEFIKPKKLGFLKWE